MCLSKETDEKLKGLIPGVKRQRYVQSIKNQMLICKEMYYLTPLRSKTK